MGDAEQALGRPGQSRKHEEPERSGRRSCRGSHGRIPRLKPTVESRKEEAMVETWQMEPGGQQTEAELVEVETQAEPKGLGDTKGPGDQGGAELLR